MFVILPVLSLTLNPVHCVQFCFLYMSDSVFPSCLHSSECEFPFVPCWFVGLFICSSIYIELQQNKISDNIRQEGVYDGMLDTQYLSEFIAVSQYDNNNRIFDAFAAYYMNMMLDRDRLYSYIYYIYISHANKPHVTKHLALCSSTHCFGLAIGSVRGPTGHTCVFLTEARFEWFRNFFTLSLKLASVSYRPSLALKQTYEGMVQIRQH